MNVRVDLFHTDVCHINDMTSLVPKMTTKKKMEKYCKTGHALLQSDKREALE